MFPANSGSFAPDGRIGSPSGKPFTLRQLTRVGSPGAVRPPGPGSPGPPRFERSNPALGCSGPAPEEVDGAVGPAFLHRQRRVVPKARALSHYSEDAF